VRGAVATEDVSLHDNGGTCFVSGSPVPLNVVTAVNLIAVRTGPLIRPGRINERASIEYTMDAAHFADDFWPATFVKSFLVRETGLRWFGESLVGSMNQV